MERISWTTEEIKNLLIKNNKFVERSVVKIFEFQTIDEQNSNETYQYNGIGYNKFDGEIMSSFAKQINEGKHLTIKQMAVARKRIMKYTKQLTKIANDKLQKKYEQQSLI